MLAQDRWAQDMHGICMGHVSMGYVGTRYAWDTLAQDIWAQDMHELDVDGISMYSRAVHRTVYGIWLYCYSVLRDDRIPYCIKKFSEANSMVRSSIRSSTHGIEIQVYALALSMSRYASHRRTPGALLTL